MTVKIPGEDVDLLITALEHYFSYTVAKNAEDSRYRNLADRLKRKPTERENSDAAVEGHQTTGVTKTGVLAE